MKYRVAVVGATGYSGLELIQLILRHPGMECVAVMASQATGEKPLSEIHPRLLGLARWNCLPLNAGLLASLQIDTAFLCTPNEVSRDLAPELLKNGARVVDLSGSFRLRAPGSYPGWYGFIHPFPKLLEDAVYGLPEWNAGRIAGANLIANPGCYPTSALLPLLPLTRNGLLDRSQPIICDSKSGVTGAGRSAKTNLLFGELSENFRPYSPIAHRHAPEICQELDWDLENFAFVPHLLPVNRGILSSIYICFPHLVNSQEIEDTYLRSYRNSPFVRILGEDALPELKAVDRTNFCDLGWRIFSGGRRAVLFSAIDNLVKGAAGQAVQNFNLMHGFEETLGLPGGLSVAADR